MTVADSKLTTYADEVYAKLRHMYSDRTEYEDGVSQTAHGEQAAAAAAASGAEPRVVIAALLHDIGWKLAEPIPSQNNLRPEGRNLDNDVADDFIPTTESLAGKLGILSTCGVENASEEQQRAQHDVIGANFLRMLGFDELVPHVVEGHVLAKRYLCYKEADYHEKLSDGSKRTLVFQGGPMTAVEAEIFEKDPYFITCREMRRFDELAKVPKMDVPTFDSYEALIKQFIVKDHETPPSEVRPTFIRKGNTIIGSRPWTTREMEN